MHDADAIEAINHEQLATATDRLLLRGGLSKRRPSARSLAPVVRGFYPRTAVPGPPARGSYPQIGYHTALQASASPSLEAQLPEERTEHTVRPRRRSAVYTQVFAVTVLIPTLVGLAVGFAALL